MTERIDVVAAAVARGHRYLLGLRPESDSPRAGLWEFPGGKVEPGESREEALTRELAEELDVRVVVEAKITSLEHDYGDLRVRLHLYRCRLPADAEPQPRFHEVLGWFTSGEITAQKLSEADRELARCLSDPPGHRAPEPGGAGDGIR